MTPADDGILVGSAERDTALRALTEHHGEGRLTTDEYHRRCGVASLAATRGEVRAIFRDLPAPHPIVGPVEEDDYYYGDYQGSPVLYDRIEESAPYPGDMDVGRMVGIGALVLAAVAIVVWWDELVIIAGVLLVIVVIAFFVDRS